MKAKIRKTGEIINIAEYAKIELDVCDSYGNPIQLKPDDIELIPDVKEDNFPKIDWEQRRFELAKAAMVAMIAMIGREKISRGEVAADRIVGIAHNIIEELKKLSNESK